MTWSGVASVCLMFATAAVAINRPVYKVVLTQKGFTQFLQYDVETPPLREFTFCTWIRVYDLGGDQSIFTYVANGNNRVVRLWLDSGGRYMKVSINGRVTSMAPVEIVKDVWRHVCLSYQSDYGAWAIYIDAKLVSCEIAQSLYGYVLPKGGSIIIGYGTSDGGVPSGLEGEIFGANMILTSTIERNHTIKQNKIFEQKSFTRNKMKSSDINTNYVILGNLQSDSIQNNFEKVQASSIPNKTKSHIKFQTPFSSFEHSVGLQKVTKKPQVFDMSNEHFEHSMRLEKNTKKPQVFDMSNEHFEHSMRLEKNTKKPQVFDVSNESFEHSVGQGKNTKKPQSNEHFDHSMGLDKFTKEPKVYDISNENFGNGMILGKVTKKPPIFDISNEHFGPSVGLEKVTKKPQVFDVSNEKEIFDFSVTEKVHTTTDKSKINFWNLVNKAGHEGKFKVQKKNKPDEISSSSTQDLIIISEYETPPPPPSGPIKNNYFEKTTEPREPPLPKSIFNISPETGGFKTQNLLSKNKATVQLPDVDTPPPLPEKHTKVYGQWTSSKFAGSVLNYLKSINFNHNKEKKTPATIPLNKVSDSYPYASEFKLTKLRPPVQFRRRNLIDRKMKKIHKRGIANQPQINVQILEDDLRDTILKLHAETQAKNVEVTNRGQNVLSNRFNRNVDSQVSIESSESIENVNKPRPFKLKSMAKKKNILSDFEIHRNNNLMTILPFLKSLEYFVEDSDNTVSSDNVVRSSDMYTKSLSNRNKWHNVKSYSNDYTPRRINIDSNEGENYVEAKIAEANIKHPSIRLKYKHENNKIVKSYDDPTILKGRELAMSVSNQSDTNKDSISIIKYNHGFLPSHESRMKNSEKINSLSKKCNKNKRIEGKNNFNKHVKLGNALNERTVIGYNEEHKKQSFVGGDDKIPDINRYRSDIDSENVNVPSSLGPRVCKDVDFDDRVLYVQPDQSIDTSHILSPVKKRNKGVEFIQQNYLKCSLDGSNFERSYLLFIDWSKTPVRLFGGAYAKTTTDLCGFF
ncbi:hypothetical protein ABMA28_000568 [Loxostege sticticalis]|uniref:Pentraxin (PTX) domain-containing protein n=1 Tax=Loxostege sticticalis TaxID=481309 RepID=A0ABD0TT26_LOXSC